MQGSFAVNGIPHKDAKHGVPHCGEISQGNNSNSSGS